MHWHGIRQYHSNTQDGANGATECPIPPGSWRTYTFQATQYGTSWYHSHFSAQYGNGVLGTIQIYGPASANYDVDLGVFPIGDWYYDSADNLVLYTQENGPPASDNVMFNGTNINPADPSQGAYANVSLTPGQKHRLRIINTAVENHFSVSLVGHNFTIISTDLVPITPVVVDSIFVGVGQRYDIIIDASESVSNYWFNVTYDESGLCGSSNNPYPAAIFSYEGAGDALPTDQGTAPANTNCMDEISYVPILSRTADEVDFIPSPANNLSIVLNAGPPITWFVNGSAMDINWNVPALEYVLTDNTSYPTDQNLVFVDEPDVWTYWVIQNLSPLPHPMHLHGHDYLVLGRSTVPVTAGIDMFSDSDVANLNYANPTRRDVTMLPADGWLALAFKADNPGNWLFHCHIAWHASGGLAIDFMESRSEQAALISDDELTAFQDNCAAWNAYVPGSPPKIDSGL